jgi:tRNA(Met) C34 N-acetyltransferase TmcA
MLVLQDFEALRPNLLARTIETVQGGGMVCILLKTMSSLKQLYTLTMVRDPQYWKLNFRMYIHDIVLTHMTT